MKPTPNARFCADWDKGLLMASSIFLISPSGSPAFFSDLPAKTDLGVESLWLQAAIFAASEQVLHQVHHEADLGICSGYQKRCVVRNGKRDTQDTHSVPSRLSPTVKHTFRAALSSSLFAFGIESFKAFSWRFIAEEPLHGPLHCCLSLHEKQTLAAVGQH